MAVDTVRIFGAREKILAQLAGHRAAMDALAERLLGPLEDAASRLATALAAGNKVLAMGNGGSAADAQHFVAELVGRYVRERRALAAIALTTDSSILTAVGNDYGYDAVFQRQVEALARAGDVVVGISTSGQSTNVAAALRAARDRGCVTIALAGRTGGAVAQLADVALVVPVQETARIQEAHITIIHVLCELVEEALAGA